MAVKFEPLCNGTTVINNLSYNFTLDNIRFTNATPPAAAVAQPNMICNFDTGANLITWPGAGTTPGAIYVAGGWNNSSAYSAPVNSSAGAPSTDPLGSIYNTCPPAGAIGSSFFPDSPGNNNSPFAAHITGQWGDDSYPWIQFGLNLLNPRAQTSLAAYSGVKYYAKVGSTGGAWTQFQVKFPNAFSDPQGGICNNATYGGACGTVGGVQNVNCNCANDHRVVFTWTTSWVQYTVNFTGSTNYPAQDDYWGWPGPGDDFGGSNNQYGPIDFQTGNSAVVGGSGVTPIGTVYAVQFQTYNSPPSNQGQAVDFWVDDVTFF
jgi:hypothetical protein